MNKPLLLVILTLGLIAPFFSSSIQAQCNPQVEICNLGPCVVNVHNWVAAGDVFLGNVLPGQCQTFPATLGENIRVVDSINNFANLLFDVVFPVTSCDLVTHNVDTDYCLCTEVCPPSMTVECGGSIDPAVTGFPSATCPGYLWTFNDSPLGQSCDGTFTRSWAGTLGGNDAPDLFCSQDIMIVDTTEPIINMPAEDFVVECDGTGNNAQLNAWLNNNGGATASDGCNDIVWENDFTGLSNECGATGETTVTFTATDDCGNSSSTTATFTIEDTTDPPVTNANDLTVECDGAGNTTELIAWLSSNGGATASDACGAVVWSNSFTSLSDECGATGQSTVTFTATDDCGNTSSTTATFTIEDTTAPDVTAPADETVECDGSGNMAALQAWLNDNGGATASDVCSDIVWSNDFTVLSNDCGGAGSTVVNFTATDNCGNTSSTTATFTLEDTTDASVTGAIDLTVQCDGAGNINELNAWLNNNGGAAISDVCSDVVWTNDFISLILSLSNDCGATGSGAVTFTASYDCGNTSSTTATFTIEDYTEPNITNASDQTVECDGNGNQAEFAAWLTNNGGATGSDVCGSIVWSNDSNGLSVDCGATGDETVTFTATDDCGNSISTSATFTIVDTVSPVITEATSVTVECDGSGNAAEYATWLANNGGATASDVCSEITWTNDDSGFPNNCGATGEATITFTATDGCGNSASSTATFTIVDTTDPVVTDASDVTVECDGVGNASQLIAWLSNAGGAIASDECGLVVWTNNFTGSSDDCGETGDVSVMFTATDECGNTSTTTATFTIEDTTDPIITLPLDTANPFNTFLTETFVECDGNGNIADYNAWLNNNGGAIATDVCGGTITWSHTGPNLLSNDCGETGTVQETFTATDECGNTSSVSLLFTIEDRIDPVIVPAVDFVMPCDPACPEVEFNNWLNANGGASASDICSSSVTWSNDAGPFVCIGPNVVTFTATDDCGNTSSTTASFSTTCIPTAGEWGLLCLSLSFVILGLVFLREECALSLREG